MSTFRGLNVFTCPYCGSMAAEIAQQSGNNFGAKYRSDMFVFEPMGFDTRIVAKCLQCGKYYLLTELKSKWVDDGFMGSNVGSMEKVSDFNALACAVEQFRDEGRLTPKNEFALRLRMLWASNNSDCKVDSTLSDSNRRALLDNEETSGYLRVELLRELGEFDAAATAVDSVSKDDGWFEAIPQLKDAIAAKRSDVYFLSPP